MRLLLILLPLLLLGVTRLVPESADLPTCGTGTTRVVPCFASGGTDFTALDSCKGAWLLYSDDVQTGAEADRCAGAGQGGSNPLTTTGSPTFTGISGPSGTAGLQDAVSLSGAGQYFNLADNSAFDSVDYSLGCWVKQDAESGRIVMRKGLSTTVTMGIYTSVSAIRGHNKSSTDEEQSPTLTNTPTIWSLFSMRVDTGAASTVEIFKNGVDVCTPPCRATTARADDTGSIGILADRVGGFPWNGDAMECHYFDPPLTDAQLCEVTLCGLDGTADGTARESLISNACTCASIGNVCC